VEEVRAEGDARQPVPQRLLSMRICSILPGQEEGIPPSQKRRRYSHLVIMQRIVLVLDRSITNLNLGQPILSIIYV
jgi:hypothetical protein